MLTISSISYTKLECALCFTHVITLNNTLHLASGYPDFIANVSNCNW
jgi:hypothetical protein